MTGYNDIDDDSATNTVTHTSRVSAGGSSVGCPSFPRRRIHAVCFSGGLSEVLLTEFTQLSTYPLRVGCLAHLFT